LWLQRRAIEYWNIVLDIDNSEAIFAVVEMQNTTIGIAGDTKPATPSLVAALIAVNQEGDGCASSLSLSLL